MARPNNSAAISGYVQGLREAKAAFQALPEIVRDRTNAATETTISEIARLAKGRILASPSIRTRALLNHIAFKLNKNNGRGRVGVATGTTTFVIAGRKVKVKGIITAGKGGSASTSAGAKKVQPTRYAHLVEFGSRHARAEPFMLPSAEAQKQAYLARCRAAGTAIEQDTAAIGLRNL